MLHKFHYITIAKIRHLAILAIFGGDFGYLIKNHWFLLIQLPKCMYYPYYPYFQVHLRIPQALLDKKIV